MADTKQTTTGNPPPQKKGLFKYLDNTIGEDGLHTNVTITLTNETAVKIIASSVAATVLCSLTYFMIKSMMKKPQLVTIYDPKIHG